MTRFITVLFLASFVTGCIQLEDDNRGGQQNNDPETTDTDDPTRPGVVGNNGVEDNDADDDGVEDDLDCAPNDPAAYRLYDIEWSADGDNDVPSDADGDGLSDFTDAVLTIWESGDHSDDTILVQGGGIGSGVVTSVQADWLCAAPGDVVDVNIEFTVGDWGSYDEDLELYRWWGVTNANNPTMVGTPIVNSADFEYELYSDGNGAGMRMTLPDTFVGDE